MLKKVTKMCFVTRHQASYIKTSLTSKGKQIKKKTHIDKTSFPSKGQQTKGCVTKSGFYAKKKKRHLTGLMCYKPPKGKK